MMSFLHYNNLKLWRFRGILVTSGSFILGARYQSTSTVESAGWENKGLAAATHSTRTITLYQYQSCPFCSKTRAFLDYYGIKYGKVEVNPLFKREMKFSTYKKVPFIVVEGDGAGSGLQVGSYRSQFCL